MPFSSSSPKISRIAGLFLFITISLFGLKIIWIESSLLSNYADENLSAPECYPLSCTRQCKAGSKQTKVEESLLAPANLLSGRRGSHTFSLWSFYAFLLH